MEEDTAVMGRRNTRCTGRFEEILANQKLRNSKDRIGLLQNQWSYLSSKDCCPRDQQ
jgi:hypothetical protein